MPPKAPDSLPRILHGHSDLPADSCEHFPVDGVNRVRTAQAKVDDAFVCSNCHGRSEGHLSGSCDLCHTPEGWVESMSFVTDLTPKVPHGLEGKGDCLMYHDLESEMKPAPCNHGDHENEQCILGHKSEP